MRKLAKSYYLVVLAALLLSVPVAAELNIHVRGLFKGSAVLEINGRQQLLKVGKSSPEGVKLIAADPRQAVVEINGEQQTLTLSRQISGSYQVAEKRVFSIPINGAKQYLTTAQINGRRVKVLIDTGANSIAMSSAMARRLGLLYAVDEPTIEVQTASGRAPAYLVVLDSVDVGGIKANRVEAIVIEGEYPTVTLLGMTYLQHVNMREASGILHLESKY